MKEVSAEEIVKKALDQGSDEAEVFVRNSDGISVEAKKGEVEALEASRDFNIAIRVIKGKKLGFSFTTNPENIEESVNEAVQGAEWTERDECLDIPGKMDVKDVLIFDEKIKNINKEDIIREAVALERYALGLDGRVKKVRTAEVSSEVEKTVIVNSKGVNVSYESTYYLARVTALAVDDKGESQMGWEFSGSRRMSDVDIKSVGEGASAKAIELLGSRRISTVKASVLFSPSVASDFIRILSASLSAEAVQKNRSFLAGRTGKQVISPLMDVIDDGTLAWGTGTGPVDDEGVASMYKKLISKGVLEKYIHNTYTANKDGVSSTGNAARSTVKTLPGVGVKNLYISAESGVNEGALIKMIKKGILVKSAMGVHTANQVSGDFSIGISGLWIENGEVLYPVKEAVISGNILDMFKNIEAAGNNLRFFGNVGSPSLLTGEMDISA